MIPATHRTTLPATLLLAAAVGGASQPSFHPEQDLVLPKRFGLTTLIELDEVTVSLDGNDVSDSAQIAGLDLEASIELLLSDEYRAVGDGRPLELLRSFEELTLAYDSGNESETEQMDELEGVEVLFTWDEELGEYELGFSEESASAEEELLQGLIEDMDFRALLPGGEVSVGDGWDVADEGIQGVLLPGLKVRSLGRMAQEEGEVPGDVLERLEEMAGGFEMRCELGEKRDEGGRTVSVIEVSLEGDGSMDIESLLLDAFGEPGDGVTPEIGDATLDFTMEGDGELLWDSAAGHMVAFHLEADLEIEVAVTASIEVQGGAHEIEGGLILVGELEWDAGLRED